MVAMGTNSNITVPQKYTAKYKNVGYGWDTSHPTTISKKFIILIYHYLHAVPEELNTRQVMLQSHQNQNQWTHLLNLLSDELDGIGNEFGVFLYDLLYFLLFQVFK